MVDWIAVVATVGVGIVGAAASSAVSSMIGKLSVNKRMTIEKENMNKLIDECKAKNKAALKKKFMGLNKDCYSCQRLIPKKAVYCAHCGKPIAGSKKCPKCDISLPDKAVFCYQCGVEAIEKDTSEENVIHEEGSKKKISIKKTLSKLKKQLTEEV